MSPQARPVSKKTQNNWLTAAAAGLSGLIAMLSGVYFLFLPSGGYQGGRNPMYGVTILFSRQTWEDMHTWGGVAMIAVALVHLILHWQWVVNMTSRVFKGLTGAIPRMRPYAYFNVAMDLLVALTFLLTAASGIYFLFTPSGRAYADPMFLFSRTTWDLIHTWAGVVLGIGVIAHVAIHWRWITNVAGKLLGMAWTRPALQPIETPAQG
jgi:hypothetical protein